MCPKKPFFQRMRVAHPADAAIGIATHIERCRSGKFMLKGAGFKVFQSF
jgi:hypothetical protein